MLTITTQDKTTAVTGFAKNQTQVLEVMVLPVIKTPVVKRTSMTLDSCLDALAALAMSEILADSNPSLASEYLEAAVTEAYALGRNLTDGEVPMMLRAHPALSTAFINGQYDADDPAGTEAEWMMKLQ